jgi:hypothetical protein
MEDEYDPIEIMKDSNRYLNQMKKEAENILNKNAPRAAGSLEYLIAFSEKRVASYNRWFIFICNSRTIL